MKTTSTTLTAALIFIVDLVSVVNAEPPSIGNIKYNSRTVSREELIAIFPLLDGAAIDHLYTNGEFSHFLSKSNLPLLVPDREKLTQISNDLLGIGLTVGVEVIRIIPGGFREYSTSQLADKLLELSTLEGLMYYSESRERMHLLFEQSYVTDDANSRQRFADPTVGSTPATGKVTVFQEDTTFGKNLNSVTYEITDDTIHMVTENMSTFSWGPIPIIRTGRLHLHVFVLRMDDYIVYYGNFGAKALRVSLFEDRIHNSFYYRLLALYGWFEGKLDA